MNDTEDLRKIEEVIQKHKVEARDADESVYDEFIGYESANDEDDVLEVEDEDYDIPEYSRSDLSQFNTYTPSLLLTDEEKKIVDSCKDPELKQLLFLNRTKNIQLMQLYKKIKDTLEECQRNIASKEEQIAAEKNVKKVHNRIWRLGTPYFKSKDDFPCPRNEDTIRKQSNKELLFYEMTPSPRWSAKEMKRLFKGIAFQYKVNQEMEIKKQINLLEEELKSKEVTVKEEKKSPAKKKRKTKTKAKIKKEKEEDSDDTFDEVKLKKMDQCVVVSSPECIEKKLQLQELKNRLEDVKNAPDTFPSLGDDNCIDWNKISEIFLNERYTAQECRIFWNTYLHPSINKGSWTDQENENLKYLVAKYNCQNWDQIASDLGNNRSGFVACIHYFGKIEPPRLGRFTPEEDKLLCNLVDQYKQGEYIPWTKIAHHFKGRTRGQLFYRHKYFLSCRNNHVKGKKFSEAEDILILVLVNRFGKRFTKCIQYFPNRSVVQIKARYTSNLKHAIKKGSFTIEEDKIILEYVKKMGSSSWEPLVNILNRCNGQIRQRYKTISHFMRCNPDATVEDAPRRRHAHLAYDAEYEFLRCMADKFKDSPNIPTLEDIERLLVANRKPKRRPPPENTIKTHIYTYTKSSKEGAASKETDVSQNRENRETPRENSKSSPKKTFSKRKSAEPPENEKVFFKEIQEDEYMPGLGIDEGITDFFSNALKLRMQQNVNKDQVCKAAAAIEKVLADLQAHLIIPANYDQEPSLDSIDLEILKTFTSHLPVNINNEYSINFGSLEVEKLIPPNLNTVVGMRSLLIKNQIFKNQRNKRATTVDDLCSSDKQILWCITNHLSNQSEDVRNELIAERNLFFKRFMAVFKFPSIMSLERPSTCLQNSFSTFEDDSPNFRTYKKKPRQDSTITQEPIVTVANETIQTSIEEVNIKQQISNDIDDYNTQEVLQPSPPPPEAQKKLTMVEKLKLKISNTLEELSKSRSGPQYVQQTSKQKISEKPSQEKSVYKEYFTTPSDTSSPIQFQQNATSAIQVISEAKLTKQPKRKRKNTQLDISGLEEDDDPCWKVPKTKTYKRQNVEIKNKAVKIKSEPVSIKVEPNHEEYSSDSLSTTSFNWGKGELVLEGSSTSTTFTDNSVLTQDIQDLRALNAVLKVERNVDDVDFEVI